LSRDTRPRRRLPEVQDALTFRYELRGSDRRLDESRAARQYAGSRIAADGVCAGMERPSLLPALRTKLAGRPMPLRQVYSKHD
jgi:hypothetical protein